MSPKEGDADVPSPSCSNCAAAGACGPSIGSDTELFDGLRKTELVRLLLQTLTDLGLSSAKQALEQEAGTMLEPKDVSAFRLAVIRGEWSEALDAAERLSIDGATRKAVRFLLHEQKFLELILQDPNAARRYWQDELSTSAFDADSLERARRAGSYLACCTSKELQNASGWSLEGSRDALWARIASSLPARLVVPTRRLSVLLWQALRYQQLHCLHGDGGGAFFESQPLSLLEDFVCEQPPLPVRCAFRLERHSDEVWFAAASNDGRYLASSSKDRTVILWERSRAPEGFKVARVLFGHSEPCSHLAWSPDDHYLLTASSDRTVRLWAPPEHTPVRIFQKHSDAVTSVGWLHDSRRFVSAGFDCRAFLWDVDGTELYRWEFPGRVQDLGITRDGARMLLVSSERNLKIIDMQSCRELPPLPEGDDVTSLCTSKLRDEVLVSVAQQVSNAQQTPVIRLWDLTARRVAQRYFGHMQGRFVVRCCFGGPREEFVVSGSEDAQVYVWHRHHGSLLQVLPGHSATVNAVCWAAALPADGLGHGSHLVSAADDNALRVWSSEPLFVSPADGAPLDLPDGPPSTRSLQTASPDRGMAVQAQGVANVSSVGPASQASVGGLQGAGAVHSRVPAAADAAAVPEAAPSISLAAAGPDVGATSQLTAGSSSGSDDGEGTTGDSEND